MKTAVLIPCYNESVTIEKVVRDYRGGAADADIYVYDNNSKDGTDAIARREAPLCATRRRQGKGTSSARVPRDRRRLLPDDRRRRHPGRARGGDGAHGAGGQRWTWWWGDRLSSTYFTENKRPFHNAGNVVVRKLVNLFSRGNVTDIMTGYRAFSRTFCQILPVLSQGFEIETEMTIHAGQELLVQSIPVTYRDRPEGSTSKLNTYADGLRVLRTIFRLYRTTGRSASLARWPSCFC